ncbi:hypothetical protein AB5I41_10860 [Sphingomonas sp. MMS24-JH45]
MAFAATPDFRAPADANHDNVYQVSTVATDAFGLSSQKDLSITVDRVNALPTAVSRSRGWRANNSVLSATQDLADRDGLGTIEYHWQCDGVDIADATGSTYTVTAADVAHVLRAVVHYVDGYGRKASPACRRRWSVPCRSPSAGGCRRAGGEQ